MSAVARPCYRFAVLLSIVVRTVLRSRRRLLPLVIAIVLAFIGLIVGNGILASSNERLYRTYAAHLSGDLSVGAAAEANFTIFGSDSLLVGEYQVPPTLIDFERLQDEVDAMPEVRASAPVVTAAARVEVGSRRANHTIIGVDFERYREMFDELDIVEGRMPERGERAVLLQDQWGRDVVGRRAVVTAALDLSFAIREVEVAGLFRFPISDEQLDRVIITDVQTARAMNGYVAGAAGGGALPEADRAVLESDFDDLFGAGDDFGEPGEAAPDEETPDDASGEVLPDDAGADEPADSPNGDDFGEDFFGEPDDFGEGDDADEPADEPAPGGDLFGEPDDLDDDPVARLEAFFAEAPEDPEEEPDATAGAWNFLLISLHDRGDAGIVERRLAAAGFGPDSGYTIRDWRGTVGGNAQIAWYLQLMFNIGVLFIAAGAAMITTNALVLSVLERTGEIGTMRALGATRARVSAMIVLETLLVVVGAAAAGIALGAAVISALNAAGITVDNPYIDTLFGGGPVSALLNPQLIGVHLAAGFLLSLVAVVYPLKRALGIEPVEAMRE